MQALSPSPRFIDDEQLFAHIAYHLECSSYVIIESGLPQQIAHCLTAKLVHLESKDFKKAAIGKGGNATRNSFVRRDTIHWIKNNTADMTPWLNWTDKLRIYLNRRLYLGLRSFESHFAHYREGDFYKTHYDTFQGSNNRCISMIAYINSQWHEQQGGELVLYEPDMQTIRATVTPHFATLVLFLSQAFPHEVKPVKASRYSVSGWFRTDSPQELPTL